ncbi:MULTISPECIES: class I SAM-dependent methyltransferase [unclassified Haematospirillum]|uniref:class I SAM-dependent methyltransferase n=1 Tax=unclassified Haematospirillum TaxID=2622088 RepID=UPI001439A4F5|nr:MULTISPECIES: class I SAM-dependent methyltransferase [unclassified Haematospirillum]NKD56034.1 class I SAM-dependent methyltransferase [Haematospirillum sp. H4890]NKD76037.1 class I SAM-dependent methyltransferase [Haematospirillum sp. H4485]NKD88707.1 class I SAM-dependent methyltransferase [Haematospirillum sp. 15-248]
MFRCALCSGQDVRELLLIDHPDRFEQSIGIEPKDYRRSWVECLQCGGATNVLPEESSFRLKKLRSAYYEVDFMGSDIGEKYHRVMSMPAGKSDNAGRVARVMDFVRRWSGAFSLPRIMDIGAGTGVFLSRLVDQTGGAWHYLGVEPDPRAAAHLRQLEKFAVVEAMYLGQTDLRGFNLVTLNKVLEHIEQPLPFLLQVIQSLVPEDGLLYVEVPDKLTARLRSPQDNILGSLHCHLYDLTSLGQLLRRAGLELMCVNRVAEPSGKLSVYAFAAPAESVEKKGLPHE